MLTVDIFPIEPSAVPVMYAYDLDTSDNKNSVSGKLAYRLRKEFGGHWTSNFGRILSDKSVTEQQLRDFLIEIWKSKNSAFVNVRTIKKIEGYGPKENDISALVAKAMFSDTGLNNELNATLNKSRIKIKNASIKRVVDFGAFVIGNKPSVSISISSNILLDQDLDNYIRNKKDPMGLYVKVKHQSMKGEVVEKVGTLRDQRERLQNLAQDELTINSIKSAPDDTEVLAIRRGQNRYDYTANSLEIILTMQNCSKFNVSSKDLSYCTKISPDERYKMIQSVRKLINEKLLGGKSVIGEAFDSLNNPDLFPNMFKLPFEEPVVIGHGQSYDFKHIKPGLKKFGLYKTSSQLANNVINIAVLFPENSVDKTIIDKFLESTKSEMKALSFNMIIRKVLQFELADDSDLEKKLDSLTGERIDLVLCVLPDYFDEDGEIEDHGIYHNFKRLTITRGIGGQVVTYKTLRNSYAVFNIILGILGKTGNIPYALSKPLEFCDIVVGIDIARQRKSRLPGSNNAAAIARVYFNDGNFLRYVIHDSPLEGETVPSNVMRSLFPVNEFKGKKVVVHRDGYFRGDEINTLRDWGKSIGSEFSLLEIIKRESPRMYEIDNGIVNAPRKGAVFLLGENSSLVVSSPPPFAGVTPRPLKVRIKYGDLQMDQAIRTILSLTELHYGSTIPPRLPVTIHYSDQIAWFALRGIKPPNLTGAIPFWL